MNVLAKIAPKAMAALGKEALLEVAVLGGFVAEGLNLVITPIVDKGGKFIKEQVETRAEAEKQKLLEKRAVVLEQKAEAAKKELENVNVEEPAKEEEPPKNTSNKKKGK